MMQRTLSIKLKATLVTTAAFVALLAVASAILMYVTKNEMQQLVGSEQLLLVSRVADELDERLDAHRKALTAVAEAWARSDVQSLMIAEEFQRHPALRSLFDELAFVSPAGKVLVDSSERGRRGVDVSDREYFQHTVATRQPYISAPFMA